jgi:hypothetical protein
MSAISHMSLWDARRRTYVASWRRPPRAPRSACELDSLEQESQLGHLHLDLNDAVALDEREPKAALLEPLRPQAEAAAVPVDPLHHRPPPIEEEEDLSRERIAAELPAHGAGEPVELLPHVERLEGDEDTQAR